MPRGTRESGPSGFYGAAGEGAGQESRKARDTWRGASRPRDRYDAKSIRPARAGTRCWFLFIFSFASIFIFRFVWRKNEQALASRRFLSRVVRSFFALRAERITLLSIANQANEVLIDPARDSAESKSYRNLYQYFIHQRHNLYFTY